jgi:hypothetical protein
MSCVLPARKVDGTWKRIQERNGILAVTDDRDGWVLSVSSVDGWGAPYLYYVLVSRTTVDYDTYHVREPTSTYRYIHGMDNTTTVSGMRGLVRVGYLYHRASPLCSPIT